MKRIAIILIACVLCFVSFVSCDNNDTRMPTELVFEYGFPSEIEMYEGERLIDNYIMYKGIVDFKNNNAVFFSSDENVVRVEVSTQEFPIYTYFNIVAVSEGNAIIFAQSADGSVTSEPIKITVRKNINSSDDINSDESLNTEEPIEENKATESIEASDSEAATDSESITETSPITETEISTQPVTENQPPKQDNTQTENKNQTYILNISSKKFHLPSCSFVSRIKTENRAESQSSHDELISQGYSACKTCKP